MNPCKSTWLNIPEGTRIGQAMAALFRVSFSGQGANPTAQEFSLIKYWPQAQLRMLRRSIVQAFSEVDDEAVYIHPTLKKGQLQNPPTGLNHRIQIQIDDGVVNGEPRREVTVTFWHTDFAGTDAPGEFGQEVGDWQVQCDDG